MVCRLNLTILMLNSTNKVFSPHPDDRLQLSFGPGLGDQRSYGLGYADSIYSFVEPVALIDGKVKRFRPKQTDPIVLPWSHSKHKWVGLHGRYFALLLAPEFIQVSKEGFKLDQVSVKLEGYNTTELPFNHLPVLSIQLPVHSIAPGDSIQWKFVIFSGPKSIQVLKEGTQKFERLVFPGLWRWMRWLSFGLLWLMTTMYAVIPNWGAVILLLAVFVGIAMYPITRKTLISQEAFVQVQKRIQPELKIIKQDYRGEEQSERILNLYKQQGTSPLAGLKPLFIVLFQLPVLIALFHVLGSAYEFHSAPFLWIETLAEPDKLFAFGFKIPLLGEYFNALPVLMALSTLSALKLSPTPAVNQSAQRRQNLLLIIVASGFFILFYPFPAGLVLYWTAANVLHIAQQRLFIRIRQDETESG